MVPQSLKPSKNSFLQLGIQGKNILNLTIREINEDEEEEEAFKQKLKEQNQQAMQSKGKGGRNRKKSQKFNNSRKNSGLNKNGKEDMQENDKIQDNNFEEDTEIEELEWLRTHNNGKKRNKRKYKADKVKKQVNYHSKSKKVGNRRQKKFEKNKWREFSTLIHQKYPNFEIQDMTSTKNELILVMRERDTKDSTKNFQFIDRIIKRMDWDPLFKGHSFNIGIKAA